MAINFFSLDENYENIIKKALKNKMDVSEIYKIKPIYTGWTNIVYRVEADNGNYYLRFPRDEFWIRTIVKDYQFTKYIKGKTSFKTVELELDYDNERPFSIHKETEGYALAEKMNDMTEEEINQVSKEVAQFMAELHGLKFNKDEIFTIDNIGLELNDFVTELLDKHVTNEDREFWKTSNFKTNGDLCLVHGDLNSSNIIVDENNHVKAIIDFGFAGFGNKYFDVSRIVGRCPESFKKAIVENYEKCTSEIDEEELDKDIKTWNNIDNGYKNYMRKIGIYKD